MARKKRNRITPEALENLDRLAQTQLVQEGTLGCIWRYTTLCGYTKDRYNKALDDQAMDYDHLAGLKKILSVTIDIPVVEVPALAFAEAHGHCQEIATRVFLESHLVREAQEGADKKMREEYEVWLRDRSVAPTLKLQQLRETFEDKEMRAHLDHLWSMYRQTRDWTYDGEPHVFLYDKPIQHVGVNDDAIADIYDIEGPRNFDTYLIGHAISQDGLVAYVMKVMHAGNNVNIMPLTEYMTLADVPSQWLYFDSYADDVLRRLCTHKQAGDPLNRKLSFRRKVQKFAKAGRSGMSRFPVDYRQLKSVGIDLFPDIAIRRGWVCKHEIESDLSPEVEEELDRRIRAGEQTMKVYEKNKEIPLNIGHGHRAIVERFLATREHQTALEAQAPEAAFREHGKQVGALLRQARIIEIPASFYWRQSKLAVTTLGNAVLVRMGRDEYLSDDWSQLSKRLFSFEKEDADGYDEWVERVTRSMLRQPWEPELPFPVCWLGYDAPLGGAMAPSRVGESDFMSMAYKMGGNIDPKKDGLPYLYGHLLTKDMVYAFFTLIVTKKGQPAPTHKCFTLVERENEWNHPGSYSPLMLNNVVDFIEDHQIVIDQMPLKRQQRAMRKLNPSLRKKRPEPPPYYTVYIKDGVYDVKKQPVREGTRGPLAYSHDRAGGTYYKIRRGPLPLDAKTRRDLECPRGEGHGYQIFEHNQPWGEWAEAVKKRGARGKGPDEWMAILKWRRRDTVVRPDLPKYIPSVRRSEKHKERRRCGKEA